MITATVWYNRNPDPAPDEDLTSIHIEDEDCHGSTELTRNFPERLVGAELCHAMVRMMDEAEMLEFCVVWRKP